MSSRFFEAATNWTMLPQDVQLIVIKQLPISYRVAFERVDTNFGEISEELFNNQRKIPIEKEFDDRWYPYSKLIFRCPQLIEFDFHRFIKHKFPGIYSEQIKPEMFTKTGNSMFKLLPNITSFKNVRNNAVQIVTKYLIDRYKCDENEEEENVFNFIEIPFSNLEIVHQIFGLINYKINHISFPLINAAELDQWEHLIDKRISIKHIKYIDDGRCVTCLSDFNYILSKLLRKRGIKLKKIKANINQENFDLLSNIASLTSFTPSLCEPTNITKLVDYSNIKHLDLLTGHFFKSLTQFGAKEYETNDAMIEFFARNGFRLKSLAINLCKREFLLDHVCDFCFNLKTLTLRTDLNILPKTFILSNISKLQRLKYLNIRSIFAKDEYNLIFELIPTLVRFDCIVCDSYEEYKKSKYEQLLMLKIMSESSNTQTHGFFGWMF